MIVIYFWYMVCVYFNGLNLICLLIPGMACRAADITTTEDAYAYDEEGTELATFSPEVTAPIRGRYRKAIAKGFNKTGPVRDFEKGDNFAKETCANSSDPAVNLVIESTTSDSVAKKSSNGSLGGAGSISKMETTLVRTNLSFEPSTVIIEPMIGTTESTSKVEITSRRVNVTFEPGKFIESTEMANQTSESSTVVVESTTSITESPPKAETISKQANQTSKPSTVIINSTTSTNESSSKAKTISNQTNYTFEPKKIIESTIKPTDSIPKTETNSKQANLTSEPSIVVTESTTNATESVPKTESTLKQINDTSEPEKITESTTTTSGSTKTTSQQTNLTSESSKNTTELTTKPPTPSTIISANLTTNFSNLSTSESTTQAIVSTQLANTSQLTSLSQLFTSQKPATGAESSSNASTSDHITTSFVKSLESEELLEDDLSLPKANFLETATDPIANQSDLTKLTKDTREQFYDELAQEAAAALTTRKPIYEEGYFDPNIAPTRYGQSEEAIATKQWSYVSDHGIGIRDYNLILYAVNNTAVLEKGSLLNYVYFVFKEILNVNLTLTDIRYCKFLRGKNPENKKPPPVLVAFARMEVKNEILHKRKLLRPTNIKVEHDMPKKLLEEQNALLKPLMDKYRAMGQYVVVRSGKLLVEGKVFTQIDLPDKYTYDPSQTFEEYVRTTVKTTTPAMEVPKQFMDYAFDDKKPGRRKKGKAAGGKKKRKPMVRIPLDEEIGHELSADVVLFTTKKFLW